MNGLGFLNYSGLYLEIGQDSLKALSGENGLELPLEREPGGRLTEACKAKLIPALEKFINRRSWLPRVRAFCAIGARGVSLRRLAIPPASREESRRLLLLQIESEFPLPPDELAWGHRPIRTNGPGESATQESLVVAVKKEVVDQYAEILSRCGINPVFTLAAMARSHLCPPSAGPYAILDVGDKTSEWIAFDNGIPTAVRTLAWGESSPEPPEDALGPLAKSLNGASGAKLFLTGRGGAVQDRLVQLLGGNVVCEPLRMASGPGRSAAILGLKKSVEENADPLLLLHSRQVNGAMSVGKPAPWKWAAAAAALVLGLLLLPYAEAILVKPIIVRKLATLQSATNRLETINRELNFLQFLKQNQPPYLDALYLFAKFAPQGARIDSLTMNRRGEVTLRGSMRSSDQVAEFRSKLIDSRFFSSVAVEEQTPTPDRQKVNVRMTALWKPAIELKALAIGPTADEIEKAKNRKDQPGAMPGGMPPGMMPAGISLGAMPPGVMMPEGMPAGAMPPGMAEAAARARARMTGAPAGAMPMELPPGAQMPPSSGPRPPEVRTGPVRVEGNQ